MPPASGELSLFDMAKLGEVFQQHRPRLKAILDGRLGPAPGVLVEADVVLQEAFLDAARRYPAFRDRQPPVDAFVWLYGLVRDRLIEAFRKTNRAGRHLQNVPLSPDTSFQIAQNLAAPTGTPSRMVQRDEMIVAVQQALQTLSEEARAIVVMHDYDGLTFAEIGQQLGEKPDTVNKRYTRAIARLEAHLTRLLGDDRP